MSENGIARLLGGPPPEVRRDRDLARIDHQGAMVEAEIDNLANVTERAIIRVAMVQRTRAVAEQLAPDGAELYALLAVAGATQMGAVISRMGRR